MPEKCPHMTSGYCTVCQALDQALAELQRVRGQRDRLAGALQPFATFAEDCRRSEPLTGRQDDRSSLVLDSDAPFGLEGHPTMGDCRRAAAAVKDISRHP
jgi:hypothetical protein